ncbi:uncharacterized protein LOC131009588 [Salvia miltiorrhiza]|uniref:uncharacterized protein LOC131009588 n=1 Tax=Salvia miltiorrhiza TaxID=226208 RepID=UPI0025AC226F|nr:uncharacterized protein LOC131009588 [Salvia miltiorrhiza]
MYSQSEPERVVHHRKYVHCDREATHLRLIQDYFNENPTYGPTFFRRHFWMQKELFLCIVKAVQGEDTYFQMSHDARGRDSLMPLQKCTTAIRQLATGVSANTFDEYLKVIDTTGRLCLKRFYKAVIWAYSGEYLRRPTQADIQRLIQMHEARHRFPRMLGSLDSAPLIFEANQRYYHMGYYLCDDIYPEWRCFVKSPPMATNPKEVSMIVENEGERAAHWRDDDAGHRASSSDSSESARATPVCFEQYMQRDAILRDRQIYAQLQRDLIEHIWARFRPLQPE